MIKRMSISVANGRGVADRWRKQYYEDKGRKWANTAGGPSEDIYNQLCALGQNPDVAKVAEIIGNKSWAHLTCSGCGDQVARAISFGSNYSGDELLLCAPCVNDATRLVDQLRPDQHVKG